MNVNDRLLRRRQVEDITGLSRSSIYRLMRNGEFPVPVRVGPAAVRWKASEITRWVESRPLATGEFDSANSNKTLPR
ncbi:MAG: AlpA family transcriptional regulator [Chloroflexi bacterium]|nr:AlpA family transcriptional regulator [Chloroflexota bacterium]